MKKSVLTIFASIIFTTIFAQFPNAVGTKWEYVEQSSNLSGTIDAFEDIITKDTIINSVTYQMVNRTGGYKIFPHPTGLPSDIDLSGTYFFRNQNDSVMVLDSTSGGLNHESVLYDFSISYEDTIKFIPKNLVDLTLLKTDFDFQYKCENGFRDCGTDSILDFKINSTNDTVFFIEGLIMNYIEWIKNIGTIYSHPVGGIPLGNHGYNYELNRLTSQGNVLYDRTITGINNFTTDESNIVKIHPNPNHGILKVESSHNWSEIIVLNAMGQIMHKENNTQMTNSQKEINISNLSEGTYFIKFKSASKELTKKFVLL